MFDGRRVLGLVAARGGSKGLPGKNLALCAGKPLVAWSVEAARGSRYVDRVVVTSDDPAILDAARAAGAEAPFVRPAALASDDATMANVVRHALDALPGFDLGVLLQATSPLRLAEDIDGALDVHRATGAGRVVSVTPAPKTHWTYRVEGERLRPLFADASTKRRQDLDAVHALNGAIYVFDVASFRDDGAFLTDDTAPYVMPAERSVDVDMAIDLALCDLLLRGRQ